MLQNVNYAIAVIMWQMTYLCSRSEIFIIIIEALMSCLTARIVRQRGPKAVVKGHEPDMSRHFIV